jgi:hypothetical protein
MFEGRNAKLVYAAIAIIWVVIVLRTAFNVKGPEDFVVTAAQEAVQAFAREQLGVMQVRSLAENVELCAIIFEDSDGELGASRIREGGEAECDLRYFDEPGMAPVASMHTHGAFDQEYDSEVPSLIDIEGDIASELDGYVATPGGRLWHIDWREERAELVCGEGCLQQDRAYSACADDPIAPAYSLPQLRARTRAPLGAC